MSVALIGANTLALVPCVPLMLPLPWLLLELSERKNQKPQQKERNRNKGIKTKQGKTIVLQIVV